MGAEPSYTLHWTKTWHGAICEPEQCKHSNEFGSEVLSINQRLERTKRGGNAIHMDACICMNCGADITGHLSLAEGLRRCMDEHGWNREVGLRLYDLAEFHNDRLCDEAADDGVWPIWFLYAWGWSGKEIVDALNAGSLNAAEQVQS